MSQSDKLRKNKNQHGKKNLESHKQDVSLKCVVENILTKLREKYPNYVFGHDKRIYLGEIEKIVSTISTISEGSYTQADGGYLWVEINGEKRYILVSEQKRQGTNDKRFLEELNHQAYGNASDRLGTALLYMRIFFSKEDILPFITFLQGCDFCELESKIPDRIRTIYCFLPQNTVNLYMKEILKNFWMGGSYFMRGHSYKELPGTSDWTQQEMFEPMMEIAEKSLEYYIEKYGK
jgi:hypothetical protein